MEHLTILDFVALFFGVLLRFGYTLNKKVEVYGNDFQYQKYFNPRHVIRWGFHLLVSISVVIYIPDILMEYVVPNVAILKDFTGWSTGLSCLVGIIGYNFAKVFEKIGVLVLDKMNKKLGK